MFKNKNSIQYKFIIINRFEEVSTGFLSKTYTIYKILTSSKGWSVKRRYNDFLWLRNYLIKAFPGIIVNFVFIEKINKKKIDSSFVRKKSYRQHE